MDERHFSRWSGRFLVQTTIENPRRFQIRRVAARRTGERVERIVQREQSFEVGSDLLDLPVRRDWKGRLEAAPQDPVRDDGSHNRGQRNGELCRWYREERGRDRELAERGAIAPEHHEQAADGSVRRKIGQRIPNREVEDLPREEGLLPSGQTEQSSSPRSRPHDDSGHALDSPEPEARLDAQVGRRSLPAGHGRCQRK